MNDKMVLELGRAEAQTLYGVVCEKLNSGIYSEYTRIELTNIKDKLMKFLQS
jgi:hypothetical protein